MERVGVGRRAIAYIIDQVLLSIIFLCVALMLSIVTDSSLAAEAIFAVVVLVGTLAYWTVLEGSNGASLGKQFLGIEVVKLDGSPMDYKAAFIRNILRLVDMLLVGLVGAIFIWASLENQRFGDMVAGTLVVYE